jgi:hypothetical protein
MLINSIFLCPTFLYEEQKGYVLVYRMAQEQNERPRTQIYSDTEEKEEKEKRILYRRKDDVDSLNKVSGE